MDCDVYHSGLDARPRAPFLLVPQGATALPEHPEGTRVRWSYWKTMSLAQIAAIPLAAAQAIKKLGYAIQ